MTPPRSGWRWTAPDTARTEPYGAENSYFVDPKSAGEERYGGRIGRLAPFPLPGGEAAIREPWRIASGFMGLPEAEGLEDFAEDMDALFGVEGKHAIHDAILEMVRRKATPMTSSCGRLFDAVSALLGLCPSITYEGQAAIRLEAHQDLSVTMAVPFSIKERGGLLELDTAAFFLHLLELRRTGVSVPDLGPPVSPWTGGRACRSGAFRGAALRRPHRGPVRRRLPQPDHRPAVAGSAGAARACSAHASRTAARRRRAVLWSGRVGVPRSPLIQPLFKRSRIMVRHIVWWTLKPEAEGRTAAENAKLIKQRLEALMGQIPSLKSLEVSYDFLPTCTMPVNVILMTTHDDAEGLKAYAEHPAHVAVGKELIKLVTESRQAIDYTF